MTTVIDPNTVIGKEIEYNRSTWKVTGFKPYDPVELPNLVRICEENDKIPGVFTGAKVLKGGRLSKKAVKLFLCFTDGESFVSMI